LPDTYNETRINVLLRDPGWVFVYWDFHTNLLTAITENHRFETFFLRVNSLDPEQTSTVTDFFDIEIGKTDRKWYVHLPGKELACRIDLCSRSTQEEEQILAKSVEIILPPGGAGTSEFDPRRRNPPLLELSGIAELRKKHFRNHRQSFN